MHTPIVTLPVTLDNETKLPLGLQIVGSRHGDDKLLSHVEAVFNKLTP